MEFFFFNENKKYTPCIFLLLADTVLATESIRYLSFTLLKLSLYT